MALNYGCGTEMNYRKNIKAGLTLTEMLIALSILAVLGAVLIPQIHSVQQGWASKEDSSERMQNVRVLADHIYTNLSKASAITAVSDNTDTNGYIEFASNNGATYRYEVADDFVMFGVPDGTEELAGPVSELVFTCYDANDITTPITDPNLIRSVRSRFTFISDNELRADESYSVWSYLFTNSQTGNENLLINGDFED